MGRGSGRGRGTHEAAGDSQCVCVCARVRVCAGCCVLFCVTLCVSRVACERSELRAWTRYARTACDSQYVCVANVGFCCVVLCCRSLHTKTKMGNVVLCLA